MTAESPFDWPATLGCLVRREDLSSEQSAAALAQVMEGLATPAQTAAFLVALRLKGETAAEMTGLVRTMVSYATPVEVPPPLIDTCGTGGDRAHTLNVSSLAALVVAGAGGRVAKHGNRAASSKCGSADLFEALGVRIDLDAAGVARCIEKAGIGFCFAPRFHPAMRHAAPVRREMGIPTIMNVLGPLSNPAQAQAQVVGVADPALADKMLEVLRQLGKTRAMVVYGHDGIDELTTTTTSTVVELAGGEVRRYELEPADLGLPRAEPAALRGGDAACNAGIARQVLEGRAGPARDIVLLNAAAALVVGDLASDLGAGIRAAADSIDSGRAAAALEAMVQVSQEQVLEP